ncbi:hypothetical protein [Pelagimonas varians]|uniref:Uncharacterized protein n=1 Tax=Pelagimonas varians TaxID=696760 RepID=A0A238L7P3_9RHOB|nr:hypothetical protein [Pelagimonas varians]PYG25089.1 hypothetical protein C8N36_13511 [Pelagimonas varians]SMX50392.1 hypothetical protein PEV8663_04626 [Pelagimonas varians]
MKTYEATVRLPDGKTTKIQVSATNSIAAVRQLEGQFGKGAVLNSYAREVR